MRLGSHELGHLAHIAAKAQGDDHAHAKHGVGPDAAPHF
jgi:hypothetical protein